MIEFCAISPVSTLDLVANRRRHLVLAHLIESNPQYVEKYRAMKQATNCTIIMDNSAFEMFKAGRPMYDNTKLIELGKKIGADYIVMSDYPTEHWEKTRDKAIEMHHEIIDNGFKTMYVPQSQLGDIDGYCNSMQWAINNRQIVQLIGLSILGCPIAFGLKENKYGENVDQAYRLQRYLSRFKMLSELESRHIIDVNNPNHHRIFHLLGATEGPNEIELLAKYWPLIASWDSSSPVWHAINGIQYDNSPTGLRNGKLESEVDFNINIDDQYTRQLIVENIKYIDDKLYNLNK